MDKTTDNVVADIYALMESKDADPSVDVEACLLYTSDAADE